MPGRTMSSTYRACPVTLSRPSRRGTEVPTMRCFVIRVVEPCPSWRGTPCRRALPETRRPGTPACLEDTWPSPRLATSLPGTVRPGDGNAIGLRSRQTRYPDRKPRGQHRSLLRFGPCAFRTQPISPVLPPSSAQYRSAQIRVCGLPCASPARLRTGSQCRPKRFENFLPRAASFLVDMASDLSSQNRLFRREDLATIVRNFPARESAARI